jgi:hypothetical protein
VMDYFHLSQGNGVDPSPVPSFVALGRMLVSDIAA